MSVSLAIALPNIIAMGETVTTETNLLIARKRYNARALLCVFGYA
jgi:hypothetical protein